MQTLNFWSLFSSGNQSPSSVVDHEPTVCVSQEPPTKRTKLNHLQQQQQQQQQGGYNNNTAPIAPRPNSNNNNVVWALGQQQQPPQLAFNPVILSAAPMMMQQQQPSSFHQLQQQQQQPSQATLAPLFPPPKQPIDAEVNDRKRKQINAMHAKKARERKKNLMACLEMEQQALQEENRRLRALVKTHIPDQAQTIIGECSYKPRGKGMFHGASSSKLAKTDFELIETLTVGKQSFVLTNPRLPDNPIVYASCSFLKMTGYTRDGAIGRNCRLLQGPGTDHEAVAKLRDATKTGNDVSVNLLNYKADGTPFWNHLFIAALRDTKGDIVNFVGVQSEIDDPYANSKDKALEGEAQDTAPRPDVEKVKSVFSETDATNISKGGKAVYPAHPQSSTALDLAKKCPAAVVSSSNIIAANKKLRNEHAAEIPGATPTKTTTMGKDDTTMMTTDLDERSSLFAAAAATTTTKQQEEPIDLQTTLMGSVEQDESALDWAHLAEVLEFDFSGDGDGGEFELLDAGSGDGDSTGGGGGMMDDSARTTFFDCNSSKFEESEENNSIVSGGSDDNATMCTTTTNNTVMIHNPHHTPEECILQRFCRAPRQFVTRTLRSELIDAMMSTHGDVTDARFASSLDVLSSMFKSTHKENTSIMSVLNGSWKSISRPSFHHGGCLGLNDNSEFVYTLGKMTFNMFKPGNLRCTVQHTMNSIEPVCRMDKHPNAAPWSLRRELAISNDESMAGNNPDASTPRNTMLKSYDISIALTIEPGQFGAKSGEVIQSPSRRLRALQTVQGYFLPDPDTPNRLTVWFTGGKLSPAPPPEDEHGRPDQSYGGLDEWIALFGAEHKKTWGETLSNLGAQLLLGAELPAGMDADGSMAYTLHRPFGGHGKGYVDVLYVDDELLITQGNSNTVHVMTTQKRPNPE